MIWPSRLIRRRERERAKEADDDDAKLSRRERPLDGFCSGRSEKEARLKVPNNKQYLTLMFLPPTFTLALNRF